MSDCRDRVSEDPCPVCGEPHSEEEHNKELPCRYPLPQITRMEATKILPGDRIVVYFDREPSMEEIEGITKALWDWGQGLKDIDNVRILFLYPGTKLEILRPGEPEPEPIPD